MLLRPRLVVVILLLVAGFFGVRYLLTADRQEPGKHTSTYKQPRHFDFDKFSLIWGSGAAEPAPATTTAHYSNIEPEDYVGAEKCATCHQEKYKSWFKHPHHWMNAAATPERVFGDFGGTARFAYLGGEGRFWRDGDQFLMSAERGAVKRRYRITRTIGSRYFQYYVGRQLAGPEPAGDPRYEVDHVLPFGYWLRKKQWAPTVHINAERNEDSDDPKFNPYENMVYTPYDRSCSVCHTTLAAGDWLLRNPYVAGGYSPYPLAMNFSDYLHKHQRTPLAEHPEQLSAVEAETVVKDVFENRIPAPILHLGIECETCHNGCKQHVEADDPAQTLPYFFPAGAALLARLPEQNPYGRSHDNVNWICARCHHGGRPQFPGGINTWNSTEFTDARNGGCYSQLRCIDCHEPHKATGPAWTQTPDWEDAKCLKCHQDYRDAAARRGHTHHLAGSDADRCMNCHMPRINEGLDRVVRTHTIFSPTKVAPIEQNGPNACNLCHLDKPIDWTLGYLRDWYGRRYNDAMIAANYPHRPGPVGKGWLKHPFQATRLVAAAHFGLQQRKDALPEILDILNDEYLLNRQFGQSAVEAIAGRSLDSLHYAFTLSPQERAAVLPRVRAALAGKNR
jgi:predicted CXXCH cytochrome family protein